MSPTSFTKSFISILLLAMSPQAKATVQALNSCSALFAAPSTNVALLKPKELSGATTGIKKPGFLAKRFAHVDKLSIDPARAEHFLQTLRPDERAFIFLVMMDHPKMVFGDLGANLMGLQGLARNAQSSTGLSVFSFSNLVPAGRGHKIHFSDPAVSYEAQVNGMAEDAFSLIEKVATAPPGAKSVKFIAKSRFYNQHRGLTVEVALDKEHMKNDGRDFVQYRSSMTAERLTGYEQFKDFFEWLANKPERQAYAKLLMEYGFSSLMASFRTNELRARHDWEKPSLLQGDDFYRTQILAPKPNAERSQPTSLLRRRNQSAIKTTKIEIGLAAHALSTEKPLPFKIETKYLPVAPKLIRDYAPAIDKSKLGAFVLDSHQFVSSARILRHVLIRMLTDLKSLNSQLAPVALSSENSFGEMSGVHGTHSVEQLASLSEFADQVESDLHQSENPIRNTLETLIALKKQMSEFEKDSNATYAADFSSEIRSLEEYLSEIEPLVESQLTQARTNLQSMRTSISRSEMTLIRLLN